MPKVRNYWSFFRLSRSPIASGICLQGLFAHTLRIQRSRCGGMFMRQGCACRLPRLDIKRAASTSAQCRWPAERGNWQLLHANVSLGHAHPLTGASRSAWKSQKENKMWMTSAGQFVHTGTEYQFEMSISVISDHLMLEFRVLCTNCIFYHANWARTSTSTRSSCRRGNEAVWLPPRPPCLHVTPFAMSTLTEASF